MNIFFKNNMKKVTQLTRQGRMSDAMGALRLMLSGNSAVNPKYGSEVKNLVSASSNRNTVAPDALNFKLTETLPDIVDQTSPSTVTRRLLNKVGQRIIVKTPIEDAGSGDPNFREYSLSNKWGSRNYKLYIPSGRVGQIMPLVIMLHGCTQSPDDFAAGTRMNQLAEELGFIVVYPAQPQSANASKCWNWFNINDQQRDKGEPSIIADITRKVIQDFPVDDRRVYVAGLSAGGAAAAIMGAAYPDLYAAIGVHSGLACGAAKNIIAAMGAMRKGCVSSPHVRRNSGAVMPVIVFHGDRDKTVNPINGDQVIAQSGAGVKLSKNTTKGKSSGGIAYMLTTYENNQEQTILEHWLLHGVAHAWSGGSHDGSYTDPKGPDASREMLRFFLQHQKYSNVG
jgi:poly(hydroxyalkanoate) depolymerase family esterase